VRSLLFILAYIIHLIGRKSNVFFVENHVLFKNNATKSQTNRLDSTKMTRLTTHRRTHWGNVKTAAGTSPFSAGNIVAQQPEPAQDPAPQKPSRKKKLSSIITFSFFSHFISLNDLYFQNHLHHCTAQILIYFFSSIILVFMHEFYSFILDRFYFHDSYLF